MEDKEILNEEITNTESVSNDPVDLEIQSLNNEISDLNDKYLRLAAELENTRRRAQIDMESIARNRAISVAEKFLPLIDAINAAAIHTPDDEGIKTLSRAAESVLSKIGITKIETAGQLLNPTFHNAIQVIDIPQSDEPCAIKNIPNTIVAELQSGYMFGDTVLRVAMVSVCK